MFWALLCPIAATSLIPLFPIRASRHSRKGCGHRDNVASNDSWGQQGEGSKLKFLFSCLKEPSVKGQLSLNPQNMVGVGRSLQKVTSQWPRPSRVQGVHKSLLLPWAVFSLVARAGFQLETLTGRLSAFGPLGDQESHAEGSLDVCWLCLLSLCSTRSKADLFSGKCSVTLTVTLERNFVVAHAQFEYSLQWQSHCTLCATAEPVWHPCLLVCLKGAGIWFPAVLHHVTWASVPWENGICCWSSIHFARRSCGAISGNNHFTGCWGNASSQSKPHEQV